MPFPGIVGREAGVTNRSRYNRRMLTPLAVVLFGLVIGSFLNVCIHRLPRSQSVVTPRSSCPHCGRLIRAWENIPVLSYLLLRGRCRGCQAAISWVYPVVELLTAGCLLLLHWKFGLSVVFAVNAVFFCLLIVLMFIDLFERLLPNLITFSGAAAGLLAAPWQASEFLGGGSAASQLFNSVLGAVFGGGMLWLVAWLYFRLKKIEGMGFGDIKMMVMVGAFLGWRMAWLTILLGSLSGALLGAAYILTLGKGRLYELPFGTFLAAGAMASVLWGNDLLSWYFGWIG